MSAKEDMSAGMATEEAQGVAQDVASIVCKHLQNHRLGQLDMKVVLERQLSNRQRTQKRVEAIPFRAGIMGNAVHWYVLQPLPDPDVVCSRDSAPTSLAFLQTECYTTQSTAEQMCTVMRKVFYRKNCTVKILVNAHYPNVNLQGRHGIIEEMHLAYDASFDSWVKTIDLKLQMCARQSVVVRQKTRV